jgi:single-strand DNA-binding protein
MYNKVFLIGNMARDPEVRYTTAGIPVAKFAIAVNRFSRNKEKNEVDFINVVAFRRLAEICGEYLKKGRSVAIEGRLQVRPYEKNGEKLTFVEVVAENMQMLGSRPVPAAPTEGASFAAPGEPDKKEEMLKVNLDVATEEEIPF